jgi:serine/threonine protein kinase
VLAGRYELGARLGQGGMADVYRGTDRVLGRPVAVKVLRESADEESDRARFVVEARTLARLSHPGLVTVLDAGIGLRAEDAGPHTVAMPTDRPFLVMELVDGPTLAQVLADGPLEPVELRSIGTRLAQALAYVHSRGIVHRDVKPGNVLLDAARSVKLTDFGIVRLLGDNARYTQTGQMIGTAAYLAPEQVTGGPVTSATDVYALGLLLLEAATGRRQYPGTALESALARLHQPPRIPDALPAAWRELLGRMTAIDPGARPDAAEVAEQLSAPTGAPTPTAVGRVPDTPTATLSLPAHRAPGSPSPLRTRARNRRRRLRDLPRPVLVLGAPAALAGLVAAAVIASPLAADAGSPPEVSTSTQEPLAQLPADDAPTQSPAPTSDDAEVSRTPEASPGTSAGAGAQDGAAQPEDVKGVGYTTGAGAGDGEPLEDAGRSAERGEQGPAAGAGKPAAEGAGGQGGDPDNTSTDRAGTGSANAKGANAKGAGGTDGGKAASGSDGGKVAGSKAGGGKGAGGEG